MSFIPDATSFIQQAVAKKMQLAKSQAQTNGVQSNDIDFERIADAIIN